jgi:hypothetical protein
MKLPDSFTKTEVCPYVALFGEGDRIEFVNSAPH